MSRTLYLECKSGISGDMTVGALLDLGADEKKLADVIKSMDIGCSISKENVFKSGIHAVSFRVNAPDEASEQERNLAEISQIICKSTLSETAKALALKIFSVCAQAEAHIHGKSVEQIHFHEIGAVDSIADICAAAFCIDDLGITDVISSPLYEGTGYTKCRHGVIPVPVPAVAEICREYSIPLRMTENNAEMITPSGASIVAALAKSFRCYISGSIKAIGYGAGTKEFKNANVLRAYLIEEEFSENYKDTVTVLQTAVDDSTPEQLGYCLDKLFEAGVKDAFFAPVYMKKGRPAYQLTVMCGADTERQAIEIIFKNTTAAGVRRRESERIIMNKAPCTVNTPYGPVKANKYIYEDISKITLEYEDARRLADEKNIGIAQIYNSYSE